MLYMDFIQKAADLTIVEADNGLFYLEPLWRNILHDNGVFFDQVSDFEATPEETLVVLKLEVEKRNTVTSVKPAVVDRIYKVITDTIEPAMLEQETQLVKEMVEYEKAKKVKTKKR